MAGMVTYSDPPRGASIYDIIWNVFPVKKRVHELGLTEERGLPQLEAMETRFRRELESRRHLPAHERAYQTVRACVRIAVQELRAE